MQELDEARLREIAASAADRMELWASFLQTFGVTSMAEVGVYRGDYAARMLTEAPGIERYYMIDPWRHLDDWNKPANQPDDIFEKFFSLPRPDTGRRGTGLGLVFAREVATLHGGGARLANHPDGGAIATLTLPRRVVR